jgi:hypothetical protein
LIFIRFNSFLDKFLFHMTRMHAFYQSSKSYDKWNTISWFKSPKTCNFK